MVFGNTLPPRVIHFSADNSITVEFNNLMEHRSVEQNFQISPKVEGTFQWLGRKLIFIPDETLSSGTEFTVSLPKNLTDQDGQMMKEDFTTTFQTPLLRFAYLNTEKNGTITISDLEGKALEDIVIPEVVIERFQYDSLHQKMYVLGFNEQASIDHRSELYVYDLRNKSVRQITNDPHFLNKSFALSPTSDHIALMRVQLGDDGTYLSRIETWIASTSDFKFERFLDGKAQGSEVFFTPDGTSLLYKNEDSNFELSPLEPEKPEDTQFVGAFEKSYGFHPYKPLLVFTKYDQSDIFSMQNFVTLFQGDGVQQNLNLGKGLARDTVFSPDGKGLFLIFSKPEEDLTDKESFYPLRIFHLYFYDFESGKTTQLTRDFDYSEEAPAVSPDSRYVLVERYETLGSDLVIDPAYRDVTDSLSAVIKGGQLWLFDKQTGTFKDLEMKGRRPVFLN